ncbi:MAG: cytochrome oxidase assembly protein [Planctomycetes bacterium]|nr:cytochrome oxidase assembly protein [Planctomycetota bacterium]
MSATQELKKINGVESGPKPTVFTWTQSWFWAWATTICAFPLIWVGGLVTTHDAGMAVPDWPGTYGYNLFLYPVTAWMYGPFDLFIEHGHRLLGSVVGLLSIALCVAAWRTETRRWYRCATIGLLLAVISQGLLGGFRVVLDGRTIAMLHGCGGPMVFALATFLALSASSDWVFARPVISTRGMRWISLLLLVSTVAQLILGAQLRHAIPDTSPSGFMSLVHLHLTMAAVVTSIILLVAIIGRLGSYRDAPEILAPANVLLLLLGLQLALGFATWVVNYALPWADLLRWLAKYSISAKGYWESLIVTGHQATGSLMIATSVWLVCRVWRRQGQLVRNPQSFTISNRSEA